MTAYILGNNPIWQIIDNEGNPAFNGYIIPRVANDPNQWKLIYRDPAGNIPFEMDDYGRVRLDDLGQIGPVYFADDEAYWLQTATSSGQVIWTILEFTPPAGGGSPPITQQIDSYNHISNPQFYFPYEIPETLGTDPIPLCEGGLFFQKSNANATDSIEVETFSLGQSDVPAQPINAFTYSCSSVGAGGETYKDFIWPLGRVLSFENTDISLGAYLVSSTSSTVEFIFRQYFGTGGSPSATVNTSLLSYECETSWAQASVTDAITSVTGKTLGTNGDDQCYLILRMPLNQVSNVSFTNLQFVHYTTLPPFEFQNEEYVFNNTIPVPASDGSDAGKVLVLDDTGKRKQWGFSAPPGSLLWTADPNVVEDTGPYYTGYLLTYSTARVLNIADYPALGAMFGNTYGGDGVTTFALPPLGGRTPIAACEASAGISERIPGQVFGEETHSQTEDEVGLHGHAQRTSNATNNSQEAAYAYNENPGTHRYYHYDSGGVGNSSVRITTDNAGLGAPMNIMQPGVVIGAILIKY